jgi:hypothetical protein
VSAEHQKQRVTEALRQLGYDFNHFVLSDFLAYVEAKRGRRIVVQDLPLAELFGAWIPTPDIDYILVNETTHTVHRAHNILHEVGHIILKHAGHQFKDVLKPELLRLLRVEEAWGCARYIYTNDLSNTPEEREAEEFVFQIQDHVSRANRLHELIESGTSIQSLRTMFDGKDN